MVRIRSAYKRGKIPKNITREHKMICDQTGFEILSGDARKQWNELLVWKGQFEERNAQEFVRGIPDNFAVYDARPDVPDAITLASAEVEGGSETGTLLVLTSANAGAVKYVSFVSFTLTTTDLTGRNLFLEVSSDGVSWERIENELDRLVLDDWQSGQFLQVAIGRNASHARLVADFTTSTTVAYDVTFSLLGGDAI